ncbi:hypothetical protein BVX94_02115 [bacterium B17]|nr:hypothetical protein BVX94_02115 [bacterium B17]
MKKSGSLRVFISVNIPDDLQAGLDSVISQLKESDAHARWVPKDKNIKKMTVNSIELTRSILKSDGAVHSRLHSGLLRRSS